MDATEPKGRHCYWRTGYVRELDDELLETLRELAATCPIADAQIGILHVGGALEEHAWDDGAVGNRDARYVIGVNGAWAPDEPEGDAFRAWVRAGYDRCRPFTTGSSAASGSWRRSRPCSWRRPSGW